jgi:hypothetical protein
MTREEVLGLAVQFKVGLELKGSPLYHWSQPLQPVVKFMPYLTQPVELVAYGIFNHEGRLVHHEKTKMSYWLVNGDTFEIDLKELWLEGIQLSELFECVGREFKWKELGN